MKDYLCGKNDYYVMHTTDEMGYPDATRTLKQGFTVKTVFLHFTSTKKPW